ncbi:hypothetical protein ACQ4PT_002461 [Festuca glaucescens]
MDELAGGHLRADSPLLLEILPPQPIYLFRASFVSKHCRRLVQDGPFLRRFREFLPRRLAGSRLPLWPRPLGMPPPLCAARPGHREQRQATPAPGLQRCGEWSSRLLPILQLPFQAEEWACQASGWRRRRSSSSASGRQVAPPAIYFKGNRKF